MGASLDRVEKKLLTAHNVELAAMQADYEGTTTYYLLLTTYYLLLTTYYLLLTTYYLPLTTYYLLLTTYYSLLTQADYEGTREDLAKEVEGAALTLSLSLSLSFTPTLTLTLTRTLTLALNPNGACLRSICWTWCSTRVVSTKALTKLCRSKRLSRRTWG